MNFKISRERRNYLFILGLALVSTVILIFSVYPNGLGVGADSVFYLNAAEKILLCQPIRLFNNRWYTAWPPLYPASICFFSLISGKSLFIAALYLNICLHFLCIILLGVILYKKSNSSIITFYGTLFFSLSPVLLNFSTMIYSELLFTLWYLIFFYLSDKFTDSTLNRIYLVIIFLTGVLASLTRYIGVVLIITISMWGFLKINNKKKVIWLSIAAFFPIILWGIRNFFLIGSFSCHNVQVKTSFISLLQYYFSTLIEWFSLFSYRITGIIFMILFLILLIYTLKKDTHFFRNALPILLFIIVYSVFLLIVLYFVILPKNVVRFLFPLYPPVFLLVFLTLNSLWRVKGRYILRIFVFALILISLINVFSISFEQVGNWRKDGRSFITKLNGSKMAWTLRKRSRYQLKTPVFSNLPHIYYFITHKKARGIPKKIWPGRRYSLLIHSLKKNKKIYIVWFNVERRRHYFLLKDIQKHLVFETLGKFKYGSVFRITTKHGDAH